MASTPLDRTVEWEGGSLSELVTALQASALPVRIEVMVPGTMGSNAGEVHLIAGGLADAFAGSLRRDDAMAALQRLEGARFLVEVRLPDPEAGTLSEPGPSKGSLKDRPLAALMRYCEDYVLTCRVQISRDQERGAIDYKRGELVGTTVDGKDGDELLPTMLGWSDGTYEIALPPPPLPASPARKREVQAAPRPSEIAASPARKRHATLPNLPGSPVRAPGTTPQPVAPISLVTTTPDLTRPFEPTKAAALPGLSPALTPKPAPPPAIPSLSSLRLSAPPPPAGARSAATGSVPDAFPSEDTKRGIPAVPAAPSPAMVAKPPAPLAAKPGLLGLAKPELGAAPAAPPKPATLKPAVAPSATPAALKPAVAPTAGFTSPKPVAAPAGQPATAKPATIPAGAVPPVKPALAGAASPVAAKPAAPKPATLPSHPAPAATAPVAPLKPAAPASTLPATAAPVAKPIAAAAGPAKPATLSSQPTPITLPAATPPPVKPAIQTPGTPPPAKPAIQTAGTPPPAKPATLSSHPAPVVAKADAAPQPAKPATLPSHPAPAISPAAAVAASAHPTGKLVPPSNDLKPASGTIQSRPARAAPARPQVAPVEVAEEPVTRPPTPPPQLVQAAGPRRRRTTARKKAPEHPVRVYLLTGLAIGIGIVLAYWLYYSLPLGR